MARKVLTTEQFIQKAKLVHGDKYDYSQSIYIGYNDKIKVFCNICKKSFTIKPHDLFHGHGCKYCKSSKQSKRQQMNTEQFIEKARKIHGDKYDYSMVNYIGNKIKVKIICPIHGVFEQKPNNHLSGWSCSKCKSSKGEQQVRQYLQTHNIDFVEQKCFSNCKDQNTLPFDFYLPTYNTCIEYDGQQHYEAVEHFGGQKRLQYVQNHDNIKSQFCANNNIKLIRIRFDENVEDKLNKELIK